MSKHIKFVSKNLKGKDLFLVSQIILCGCLRNMGMCLDYSCQGQRVMAGFHE
jgi:hypothetical protein